MLNSAGGYTPIGYNKLSMPNLKKFYQHIRSRCKYLLMHFFQWAVFRKGLISTIPKRLLEALSYPIVSFSGSNTGFSYQGNARPPNPQRKTESCLSFFSPFGSKTKNALAGALIASSLFSPILEGRLKKPDAIFSVKTPITEKPFELETEYEKKVEVYRGPCGYELRIGDTKTPSFNIKIIGKGEGFNVYLDSIYVFKQFYYEIGKENKVRIFGDSLHYGDRIELIDTAKIPVLKAYLGRQNVNSPWYLNLFSTDKNSLIDSIKFGSDGKLIKITNRDGEKIEQDVKGYFTIKEVEKNKKYLIEIVLYKGFDPSLLLEENKFNRLILNLGFRVGELYTRHENAIVYSFIPPVGKIKIYDYPALSFKDTTIETSMLRAQIKSEYQDTAAKRIYRDLEKNPANWPKYTNTILGYTLPDGRKGIYDPSTFFGDEEQRSSIFSAISTMEKEVLIPVDRAYDHIEENNNDPIRKRVRDFIKFKYPWWSTPQFKHESPDTSVYYLNASWPGIWLRAPPTGQRYIVLGDSIRIELGFGRVWNTYNGDDVIKGNYSISYLTTIKDANDFGFAIEAINLKNYNKQRWEIMVPALKENNNKWVFRYDSALVYNYVYVKNGGFNSADSILNKMIKIEDRIVNGIGIYNAKRGEIGYPVYMSWEFSEKGDSLIIYDENPFYKFNERELTLEFENWNNINKNSEDTTKPYPIEFNPKIGQENVPSNSYITIKWSEPLNPYKVESVVYSQDYSGKITNMEGGYILDNNDSTLIWWSNNTYPLDAKIVYNFVVEDLNKNKGTASGYFYTQKTTPSEVREEEIFNLNNELKVYDMMGRVVRVFKPGEEIEQEELPTGLYIVYDGKNAKLMWIK